MSTEPAAHGPPEVLGLEKLSKVYNPHRKDIAVRALDGVSFRVVEGEAVAIIGPSGCGKSTLLHILGCLDRPTEGSYRLAGRDVAALSDNELARVRNQHIGFVFQSFHLLPRLSAVENVELPLLYGQKPSGGKSVRERAMEALTKVGIDNRAKHLPSELSGGQRQRVAIARALVNTPSMLLCDEPTGALDSKTGHEVLALLLDLREAGGTLLTVTHDVGIASAMDRVIWMKDGVVEEDGPARTVVEHFLAAQAAEVS